MTILRTNKRSMKGVWKTEVNIIYEISVGFSRRITNLSKLHLTSLLLHTTPRKFIEYKGMGCAVQRLGTPFRGGQPPLCHAIFPTFLRPFVLTGQNQDIKRYKSAKCKTEKLGHRKQANQPGNERHDKAPTYTQQTRKYKGGNSKIANSCCSCDVKAIQSMYSEIEFTSLDCSGLRFVRADALQSMSFISWVHN